MEQLIDLGIRVGLVALMIEVKASPGLPTQAARLDHSVHDRCRSESIPECLLHHFPSFGSDIDSDFVSEREWPNWKAEPNHGSVDDFDRHTIEEQMSGFDTVRCEDPIDPEAGTIGH